MTMTTSALDLDDEPVEKSAGVNEAAAKTSAAATTTAATDNLDVEFGDENMMTKSDGLDRVVPEKGNVARVSMLTDKSLLPAKTAWLHFITKKGFFRCNTERDAKGVVIGKPAICCRETENDDDAKAQLAIVGLCVHYTSADLKTGKFTKDAAGNSKPVEFEIGFVKLSRSGFRRISKMVGEDENATDFDFLIAKSEKTKGFDYDRMQTKYGSAWKAIPELKAAVLAAVQPFLDGKLLVGKLGKKISDIEFKAMFHGAAASSASSANVADLSDL